MIIANLEFMPIPAGDCTIGTPEDDPLAYSDEFPRHSVHIPYDYWVARFPVTNQQFEQFVADTGYLTLAERLGWAYVFSVPVLEWQKTEGADWRHPIGPASSLIDIHDHPAVSIAFFDAWAYLDWLNRTAAADLPPGHRYSLPTEVEWEKAARGLQANRYPWGNVFKPNLCAWRGAADGIGTRAVGQFSPSGDSPYGVADMAGNVWEWTTTRWGPDKSEPLFIYPYDSADGREDQQAGREDYRIIRGGSFKDDERGVRSACRDLDPTGYALNNLGFRVFITPTPAG